MMKISLADAAADLEALCSKVDTLEEIDAEIKSLLGEQIHVMRHTVDRSIRFRLYAESQIALAKKELFAWEERKHRFERAVSALNQHVISLVKTHPGIAFKGTLGSFKIQKNSIPSLIIDEYEQIPISYLEKIIDVKLKKNELKLDLKNGLEVPGVRLEYGEHLKIGKDVQVD